ncbi:hypothetical protein MTO96_027239 [Rhipicephalus appendiculatus]
MPPLATVPRLMPQPVTAPRPTLLPPTVHLPTLPPAYSAPAYSAPAHSAPAYSAPAYSAPADSYGGDDSYSGASSYPASSVSYTYVTYMPPTYSGAKGYEGKQKKGTKYGGYAATIRYDPTYEPNPGYKAPGWYVPYVKKYLVRKRRDATQSQDCLLRRPHRQRGEDSPTKQMHDAVP